MTAEKLASYRKALWLALAINATMFGVEMVSGMIAQSVALQADALDFLGDSFAYGVTLMVVGMALRWRASVALLKGLSMVGFGVWLIGLAIWHAFYSTVPLALVMGTVGIAALAANLASAAVLYRHRVGDANMRAVWLCSRNDAIGNIVIVIAAVGVGTTETGWPDYAVAAAMAALALRSGVEVLRLSLAEMVGRPAAAMDRPIP